MTPCVLGMNLLFSYCNQPEFSILKGLQTSKNVIFPINMYLNTQHKCQEGEEVQENNVASHGENLQFNFCKHLIEITFMKKKFFVQNFS